MKKKQVVPELTDRESVANTLGAFLIAGIYGIVAAFGFVAGQALIERLVSGGAEALVVNQNNAVGYANLGSILGATVMGLLWLSTLLIAWHRAERAHGFAAKLRKGGAWIAGAAAFAAASRLALHLLGS